MFQKSKILLLIFPFFLFSCSNEYIDFHNKINKNKEIVTENKIKSESFEVSKIQEMQLEILTTPDKKVLDKIVEKISFAKEKIYLESYIFTEKRILKSLIEAKSRGVEIKVILEKNVFGAGNINKKALGTLEKSGINVVYANNSNYRFTHSKFFIIDDYYIISTGNISYSSFTTNKEFYLIGNNEEIYKNLLTIFEKDLIGEKYLFCSNNLVVSPICPENIFIKTLDSAKSEIIVFAETMDDKNIINLLIDKHKSGVKVKILLGDLNKIKSNIEVCNKLKNAGIEIIAPKKPFIHAKVLVVDGKYIYIGSVNFTTNSIQNNREIGLIFNNLEIAKFIKNELELIFAKNQ